MRNIAVILAGGVGARLGLSTPKQFFKVAGKTVLEHTVEVFQNHPGIDEIAIVSNEYYVGEVETLVLKNGWNKVKKVLKGGKERYFSSLAAINAYDEPGKECNLIFHDAVRPLVNSRIISDVLDALDTHTAVDVAVPATDTIIKVDGNGEYIRDIPDRRFLRRGQTPQAFRLSVIRKAYEIALKDPAFVSSDDCGTVIKYLPKEKVYVVRGEESNMKLTYKEDSYLLDKLFQLKSMSVDGKCDYAALAGKVIAVFGGNSGIGADIVRIASEHGARTYSFSRSASGTDISRREDVAKAIRSVADAEGRIDFVVDTAAILIREPLTSTSQEAIANVIGTNYTGMVNIALESQPYLKQSKGQLLLFTSSSYTRGRAFYSLYSSTKAAVVNFMQAVAQEWEHDGIRVNVINPERTKTPMRVKNFGKEPDDTLLRSEKVASCSIDVLLSDLTGQVVDVKIKRD